MSVRRVLVAVAVCGLCVAVAPLMRVAAAQVIRRGASNDRICYRRR